jgi:acetyltransferase-like isoleucine patch superfamily enzyme
MYTTFGKTKIGAGTIIGDHIILGYPSRDELAAAGSMEKDALANIGGVIIGENCTFRDFGVIYSQTEIGNKVQTGHNYLVRERTMVGDGTLIGSNVIIENECKIGKNVSIQSGVYIPTYCVIGDDVFLGPNAVLTNDKYIGYQDSRKRGLEGVVIEEKASIGANSSILPGIRIGHHAVIGTGAVVTHDVEPNSVMVGVPAKKVQK